MKQDLHTHTVYSDGKNTAEEMIVAAIEKGLDTIGISDHSYTSVDETYCINKDKIDSYIQEISGLKEKYKDKIKVLCGIEQDYFSDEKATRFDYSIGSVHYLKAGDKYIPVDESAEILKEARDLYFGGDIYALVENYYSSVSDVIRKTDADIIGHFDLITKFQEQAPLFDEDNPRYISAWKKAADELLKTGKIFEINTGAISRGYRTTPYPSPRIQEYILEHGGKFIYSSDSHTTESIGFFNEKN